jgi:hypothetical protein
MNGFPVSTVTVRYLKRWMQVEDRLANLDLELDCEFERDVVNEVSQTLF